MFVRIVAVSLVTGATLACDDKLDPRSSEVAQVLVAGAVTDVLIGQSIHFEGRAATFAAVRVDSLVTWSISDASIATLTSGMTTVGGTRMNRATVTGVSTGQVELIGTAGAAADTVEITVRRFGA